MSEPRIILLCSSRFALPAMRDMVFFKQLAVVGIPAHCEELLEEVKLLLTATDILILQLHEKGLEIQLKEVIKKYGIELGFIMSLSYKIPASVYTIMSKGFFNVHPGPLPQYRGADPVFQQIRNREKLAGVTIHKLADKIDSGEIVLKEMLKLDPRDTYGLLNYKLSELAAKLIGIVIKMAGFDMAIPGRKQDETKARYFKRQQANDVTINWNEMTAETIIALINACNPWNKGALTKLKHKIIRVMYAEIADEKIGDMQSPQPGVILAIKEDYIVVSTINEDLLKIGFIYIDEGFITAARLGQLGFGTGDRFENI